MLAGVTMNLLLGLAINVSAAAIYSHDITPKVSSVVPGHAAAIAGVVAGDSIVAVNGYPVLRWEALVARIGKSAGVPLQLQVLRSGRLQQFTVTPETDTSVDSLTGSRIIGGKIWVAASVDSNRIPFAEAVRQGGEATWKMATLVFTALRRLATQPGSVSELGGPIAIAQSSVQAARAGVEVLFYLIALISVNLAVFNLLPIPILDGGQIVVQIVEAIRGRPLTSRAREYVAKIGLAFILLLFLTVTYNDLKRAAISLLSGGKG
jgi:regulator of sigma E protease